MLLLLGFIEPGRVLIIHVVRLDLILESLPVNFQSFEYAIKARLAKEPAVVVDRSARKWRPARIWVSAALAANFAKGTETRRLRSQASR